MLHTTGQLSEAEIEVYIRNVLKDKQYYNNLSAEAKERFVDRVRNVAFGKEFIGKQNLEVTDEMRIRISATIAQLTFGLDEFEILSFTKIHIYPNSFYHPTHRLAMKGFTSPTGVVALSWEDYLHGYQVPDDNYNLGLHELAHAIHIHSGRRNGDKHFKEHFHFWTKHSLHHFQELSLNKNAFLRSYGGTNFHEFFAVCVEHFFESPQAFLHTMPKLYIRTCVLLNQNPLNETGDYSFDTEDLLQILKSNSQ